MLIVHLECWVCVLYVRMFFFLYDAECTVFELRFSFECFELGFCFLVGWFFLVLILFPPVFFVCVVFFALLFEFFMFVGSFYCLVSVASMCD